MPFTRILFENGIEIGRARNSIKLVTANAVFADVCASISEEYKVRPVLLTENVPVIGDSKCLRESHLVLNVNWQKDPLGIIVSSLQFPQGLPEDVYVSLLRPRMNVQYVLGALVYHCQELALQYSSICDAAVGFSQIFSMKDKTMTCQGQSEAYYEFDALITAARRTYDALRYIIWPVFGTGGSMPRNFPKTLELCGNLSEKLRVRLFNSWETHGTKLTAYRDCIQHYVPISFGIETATLNQVNGGTWSLLLRIPDNPEAKSQRDFQFELGLDALTYGWELTNELIDISTEVIATIPGNANQQYGVDNNIRRA